MTMLFFPGVEACPPGFGIHVQCNCNRFDKKVDNCLFSNMTRKERQIIKKYSKFFMFLRSG